MGAFSILGAPLSSRLYMTNLITPKVTIVDDEKLTVRSDQQITDDFLSQTADDRLESKAPAKDFHKFASIPVGVIEKWLKEGFDATNGSHSAREIIARLTKEDLGAFITTTKRF